MEVEKMTKKDNLLKLVAASLAAGTICAESTSYGAPKKGAKEVECFGLNTMEGTNGCGIGNEQIDVANRAYANRFGKSKPMDCAGNSDCSAKNGFLAWISKKSNSACFAAGGFIFEKGEDGKLVVKDKNGVKKS
jgi:hypothetical protein